MERVKNIHCCQQGSLYCVHMPQLSKYYFTTFLLFKKKIPSFSFSCCPPCWSLSTHTTITGPLLNSAVQGLQIPCEFKLIHPGYPQHASCVLERDEISLSAVRETNECEANTWKLTKVLHTECWEGAANSQRSSSSLLAHLYLLSSLYFLFLSTTLP